MNHIILRRFFLKTKNFLATVNLFAFEFGLSSKGIDSPKKYNDQMKLKTFKLKRY